MHWQLLFTCLITSMFVDYCHCVMLLFGFCCCFEEHVAPAIVYLQCTIGSIAVVSCCALHHHRGCFIELQWAPSNASPCMCPWISMVFVGFLYETHDLTHGDSKHFAIHIHIHMVHMHGHAHANQNQQCLQYMFLVCAHCDVLVDVNHVSHWPEILHFLFCRSCD